MCWTNYRCICVVWLTERHALHFQMYFVNRGAVEVVSEDGKVVFAVINKGEFFGEISLVFSIPRTSSIRYMYCMYIVYINK